MTPPRPVDHTAFNKAAFFEDCEYQPHPGQQAVHDSSASRRVLACGVRWGKTVCAAMEALAAAMAPADRSMGWVVAPTYDLADKVFREIELVAARHLRHRVIRIRENERRIFLRNMAGGVSEVRGKSADNPVSLLGEGLDYLIVDEAARLKPTIWEGHLSQRLIDRKGWALLISTPRGKGWFYELWRRGQRGAEPDHESWNAPSWTNPHLDPEVIEAERTRLPERVFRQEYGGEFLEGSGAVFRNVRECATGEWRDPVEGETYYAGLDLAKVEDYTVLCVMDERRQVVFADRFHRLDWGIQIARIEAALSRYHHAVVACDTTGVGEPIFESLRAHGVRAHPVPFTQRSKASLVNALAQDFEQLQIILPQPELWPEGIDELEAFEYAVTDTGTVRTGAPYGCHDDCVIALALANWLARPRWVEFEFMGSPDELRALLPNAGFQFRRIG